MAIQKTLAHINFSGLEKTTDPRLQVPARLEVADNVLFDDANTIKMRGYDISASTAASGIARRFFTHKETLYGECSGSVYASSSNAGLRKLVPSYNGPDSDLTTAPQFLTRAAAQTRRIGDVGRGSGNLNDAGDYFPTTPNSYDVAYDGTYSYWVSEVALSAIAHAPTVALSTGIRLTVFNELDGTIAYTQDLKPATYDVAVYRPRIIFVPTANKVFLYFAYVGSTATEYQIRVCTVTSTAITAAATLGNAVFTSTNDAKVENPNFEVLYDVCTEPFGRIGLVARDNQVAGTTLKFIDLSNTDGYTNNSTNTITASARILTLTGVYGYNGTTYRIVALYSVGTTTLKCAGMTQVGATTAEFSADAAMTNQTSITRIVGLSFSNAYIYVAYDSSDTTSFRGTAATTPSTSGTQGRTIPTVTRFCRIPQGLTGADTGFTANHTWLIAGRFILYGSTYLLPMMLRSNDFQSTFFMVDASEAWRQNFGLAGNSNTRISGVPFSVVARVDYGECAFTYTSVGPVSRVPSGFVTGYKVVAPYLKFDADARAFGTQLSTTVSLSRVDLYMESQLNSVETNNVSHLAGASPIIFDGAVWTEESFHHGPEFEYASNSAASGGSLFLGTLANGTYTFCFTASWTDAQGNFYESAPSTQRSITFANGQGNLYVELTIPPSLKRGLFINGYRTTNQTTSTDTTFYAWVQIPFTGLNSHTSSSTNPVTSDTELVQGEQLYTTGGVLPNTPMPACRQLSLYQKRLVATGTGTGHGVEWSKQVDPGFGYEFSSGVGVFGLEVPANYGRAVASSELDDKLIIFCENGIGAIYGVGPAATGTNGEYSDFNTLTANVGMNWQWPKSLVRMPDGLMFATSQGFRLFGRNGAVAQDQNGFVGSEVDKYFPQVVRTQEYLYNVGQSISGPVVGLTTSNRSQWWFYLNEPTSLGGYAQILVYDYEFKQWTRLPYRTSTRVLVDAAQILGNLYWSDSAALLSYYQEDQTLGSQTTVTYRKPLLTTSWLQVGGIQGFQRVSQVNLVGAFQHGNENGLGGPLFQVLAEYALDYDDTFTTIGTFQVTPHGVSELQYMFQLEIQQPVQKCQALKYRFTFSEATGETAGNIANLRLTDMTLTLGLKAGSGKLAAGYRF